VPFFLLESRGEDMAEHTTLSDWIDQLKSRFNERELKYMTAHRARTGEIHLHDIDYQSKEAEHF
jgi:hypothetical protein